MRFQFDARSEDLVVPVAVDGKEYPFVLDTGATVTMFDERFREILGSPIRAVHVEAPGGTTTMDLFHAPRATISNQPLEGVSEVACVDFSTSRAIQGTAIYGLIGMDFLRHKKFMIDFDRGEIAFLRSVPDWAGTPISLRFLSEVPVAAVRLPGTGTLPFVIDTGLRGLRSGDIDTRVVHRLAGNGAARYLYSVSLESLVAARRAPAVRVSQISLAGFDHQNLVFHETQRNILGIGYLSRYVVTFDFPGETMYLRPGARFNEPSRYDLSGAHLWRVNGKICVDAVDESSASAAAGLCAGDLIDEIDSQSAGSLTMLQIRKILCLPGKHTLRVTRGGEKLDIVLTLEELPGADAAGSVKAAAPARRGADQRRQ